MKLMFSVLVSSIALFVGCTSAKKNSSMSSSTASVSGVTSSPVYELRTYYAAPGKLDDLSARFRNNTVRIFAKHQMKSIGYWIPTDNSDNKLIYILSYPSHEAREASWKAFGDDPEWQAVAKASEANGKLVTKVESVFMHSTNYSPAVLLDSLTPPRTFELRTYTASPGNLQNLHNRFRDHTMKLFQKHGISNVAYWQPIDSANGAHSNQLIYIIAHKDRATADESWKAFQSDPTWVAAKAASEVKGGGSLTTKVEPIFMLPTDYSPMK